MTTGRINQIAIVYNETRDRRTRDEAGSQRHRRGGSRQPRLHSNDGPADAAAASALHPRRYPRYRSGRRFQSKEPTRQRTTSHHRVRVSFFSSFPPHASRGQAAPSRGERMERTVFHMLDPGPLRGLVPDETLNRATLTAGSFSTP